MNTRPGRAGQRGEDLELDVGRRDDLAVARDGALAGIDPQAADLDRALVVGVRARHPGAAQRGLHPRAELAHRERLGDVVVRAELEAEDLVDLLGLGREHDDRHGLALGAQAPADLEAVHARQHHVEDDQVEDLLVEARERFSAVRRLHHFVPIALEREGKKCLDRLLVVDEKDSGSPVCHDLCKNRIVGGARINLDGGAGCPRVPDRFPASALCAVRRCVRARGPARPRAQRVAADAFDTDRAFGSAEAPEPQSLNGLAADVQGPHRRVRGRQPHGRPGRAGLQGARGRGTRAPFTVRRTITPSRGATYDRHRDPARAQSERRIVLLAHRDGRAWRTSPARRRCSSSRGVLKSRDLRKTLVLVSTSGSTTGFAARAPGRRAGRRARWTA